MARLEDLGPAPQPRLVSFDGIYFPGVDQHHSALLLNCGETSMDLNSEMVCLHLLQHHHQLPLSACSVSNLNFAKTYAGHPSLQSAAITHLHSAWLDSSTELTPTSAAESTVPSSSALVIATTASRAAAANAFTFTVIVDSGLAAAIIVGALTIAVAIEDPETRAAVAIVGQAFGVGRELEKKAVILLAGLKSWSLPLRSDIGAEEVEAVVKALFVFLGEIEGQS